MRGFLAWLPLDNTLMNKEQVISNFATFAKGSPENGLNWRLVQRLIAGQGATHSNSTPIVAGGLRFRTSVQHLRILRTLSPVTGGNAMAAIYSRWFRVKRHFRSLHDPRVVGDAALLFEHYRHGPFAARDGNCDAGPTLPCSPKTELGSSRS